MVITVASRLFIPTGSESMPLQCHHASRNQALMSCLATIIYIYISVHVDTNFVEGGVGCLFVTRRCQSDLFMIFLLYASRKNMLLLKKLQTFSKYIA